MRLAGRSNSKPHGTFLAAICLYKRCRFSQNSRSSNEAESDGGHLPPRGFFAFFGPAANRTKKAGKRRENYMHLLIRKLTPSLIVAFALAWLGLSQSGKAVVPKPDGGYG